MRAARSTSAERTATRSAPSVGARRLQPLVHDDLEHRQGQQAFGARCVLHPLVGIGRGHGLARLDVDERARAAVGERVHPREVRRVADGRQPGLQEVGAEGEQVGRPRRWRSREWRRARR